jgi:hypothetical protein
LPQLFHASVVQFSGAPGAFLEGTIIDATTTESNHLVSQKLDISEQIAFIRVKPTALVNNLNVAATAQGTRPVSAFLSSSVGYLRDCGK